MMLGGGLGGVRWGTEGVGSVRVRFRGGPEGVVFHRRTEGGTGPLEEVTEAREQFFFFFF